VARSLTLNTNPHENTTFLAFFSCKSNEKRSTYGLVTDKAMVVSARQEASAIE
jgi:hypothetical protein